MRQQLRQALGIPQDSPLVVTLSANIKGKGLQVLGRAWPAVLAACPRARWLLCGPQSPWLRDRVLPPLFEAGLGESLTMTGALSGTAVFEHLACADLHLNPSLCEGLNMVTVEAAAVGTPSITTSATGIADWVTRFACGDVVPPSDSGALADAIIKAFSNTGLLPAWSAAAVEMSREFAPDRVARQLLEILQAAVNSNTYSP